MVTLAGAVAIEQLGFQNTTWVQEATARLSSSLRSAGSTSAHLIVRRLDGSPEPGAGFLFVIVVVVLASSSRNLRRSSLGQRMLAVRSNERAAAAAGINVARVEFVAFALSSISPVPPGGCTRTTSAR